MQLTDSPLTPLCVDARTACKLLSISDRTLYSISQPRGSLPVAMIGSKKLFRLEDLQKYVASRLAQPESATESP